MKNKMKVLGLWIFVVVSLVTTTHVHAFLGELTPIVGADYEWTYMRGNGSWKRVFPKYHHGANIYVGARFLEFCGVEFGFDFARKSSGTHNFRAGDNFFQLPIGSPSTSRVSVSTRGWHIDLVGYLPFGFCFDIVGKIGYGREKPKVSGLGTLAFFSPNGNSIHSETRNIFRLGGGFQFMILNTVGIRALLIWKNTYNIKFKGNAGAQSTFDSFQISRRLFKDTASFALGAFINF